MQTVKRRCAQTAHISLHSFNFQRAKTQNKQIRQSLGASCNLVSRYSSDFLQTFAASTATSLPSVSPRFRFASFSVFRFGEAVFTETRHKPQEEKSRPSYFFRNSLFRYKIWGLMHAEPLAALRLRNILAAMQRESGSL